MTRSNQIIMEVARKYMIDPALLIKPCRRKVVVFARIETARRLQAAGYRPSRIAACLRHDKTTIYFYLGMLTNHENRVAPPQWHRPHIAGLYHCKPKIVEKEPPKVRRYLVPYAGADPVSYRLQARP